MFAGASSITRIREVMGGLGPGFMRWANLPASAPTAPRRRAVARDGRAAAARRVQAKAANSPILWAAVHRLFALPGYRKPLNQKRTKTVARGEGRLRRSCP